MHNLIVDLKFKNPDLKEAEIAGLLLIIKDNQGFTNNEFIQKSGLAKETAKRFKQSISDLLTSTDSDTVEFSAHGYDVIKNLNLQPYKWRFYEYADVKSLAAEQKLRELRQKYDLEPKREFDQFFATVKTSVAKANILHDRGMVEDKKIALLGDDDLVSLTLALLEYNYAEIHVFDIDTAILATIDKMAAEVEAKNIYTHIVDARKPLEDQYKGQFDVVMTDPPYTRSGIALFLNKALQLLAPVKDDSGKYVFLCYGNSLKEPEKTLKVQDVIQKHNLVIEDKINKFNVYHGAESIGSTSSLYILKANKHTKLSDDKLSTEIYTYENISEEKFPYVDHYVFKLFKVPSQIVTSKKGLLKLLGEFCNLHNLKVVDNKVTRFKGGGQTVTFVLANSNLVMHTWPEHNALHIDLVTCSPIDKKDNFAKNLSNLFKTNYIEITCVE